MFLHYGDLSDASNISRIVEQVQPDEVYNLGAQSHVQVSFEMPEYTGNVDGLGTLRLLDAIKEYGKHVKFYQAGSSEMFGKVHEKRLAGWKKMLPISEQLTLKEGVPILFTVNKWGKFVNGERGILRKIDDDHLIVEKEEEYVRVERHDFELLDMTIQSDGRVKTMPLAILSQFPLRLAYAVTIHKSQGMSIDNLVCNVDNIFAPSQFYVAISRAVNPKRLKIDFNRGDLRHYLRRVVHVDERVVDYYKRLQYSNLHKPGRLYI